MEKEPPGILPPIDKQRLRAVSLRNKTWPQNKIINIKFIGDVIYNIELIKPENRAKKIIEVDKYIDTIRTIVYLGPDNDISKVYFGDTKNQPKRYGQPYRMPGGYFIDQNDNPIIPNAIEILEI
jgi:hypothetical protein